MTTGGEGMRTTFSWACPVDSLGQLGMEPRSRCDRHKHTAPFKRTAHGKSCEGQANWMGRCLQDAAQDFNQILGLFSFLPTFIFTMHLLPRISFSGRGMCGIRISSCSQSAPE